MRALKMFGLIVLATGVICVLFGNSYQPPMEAPKMTQAEVHALAVCLAIEKQHRDSSSERLQNCVYSLTEKPE